MFEIKLPARINVLGNPSDANEGAHQTISAAINVWGGVGVTRGDRFRMVLRLSEEDGSDKKVVFEGESLEGVDYGTVFKLQAAAIKTLMDYSPEMRERCVEDFPVMDFWTDIPRQSGLGGSTVLILLTMLALVRFYRLDPRKHNDYVLGELAQRAEENELGITCGFADRYVPLFGDIAYIDYRGKLFHDPIKQEPYCTYEKLGRWVDEFPLVMCSTGVKHDSGNVHRPMRGRYLEEYKEFRGDYENAPFMVKVMKKIGETAWRGKIALLEKDFETFGALMNENHKLVDEMMHYCGFTEGAGEANNRMIQAGLEAGAYGAKLTGAGGGGSVFMIVPLGQEQEVSDRLRQALKEYGYTEGKVFIPSIAHQGGVVLERDQGRGN